MWVGWRKARYVAPHVARGMPRRTLPAMKNLRSIVAASLLGLAALAPAAGASSFVAPQLKPVPNGNLWKTGTLYTGTMYAQAGGTSMAQLSPITLTHGSVQLGLPTLSTYQCDGINKKKSPAARAIAKPFKPATCTLIATKKTPVARTVQVVVPSATLGSYLSVLEEVTFLQGGTETAVQHWTEVPVYPINPVAAGAPTAVGKVYAGAPTSYLVRGWTTPPSTVQVGEASQAWVCPDTKPNTDTDPLSEQGCNRVYNEPDSAPGETGFTLSGRIHKEHTQGQYLYHVAFTTIDPIGPLGEITYEIRSKGKVIKPIPAPKAIYDVEGTTITATFTGMDGVDYSFSATRVGSNRQFASRCSDIGIAVQCQVEVESGSWKTTIVPLGKLATGTVAKRTLQTTS